MTTKNISVRERSLAIIERRPAELKSARRNARKHTGKQLKKLARSIEQFGIVLPILVDEQDNVIAGNAVLAAARQLGLPRVPTVVVTGLSEADWRALTLALNRLAEESSWDEDILREEFEFLLEADYGVAFTGFDTADLDALFGVGNAGESTVTMPSADEPVVSRSGDIWKAGNHLIICGDARQPDTYARLLGGERAEMVFTDPPYNVKIGGNVSGLGRKVHREFAMASGEISEQQFAEFLQTILARINEVSRPAAIAYVCMDWKHIAEVQQAARAIGAELKKLCVWAKTNAGMGSFYRSQHELVFVLKSDEGEHINNFGLGGKGRHRSNLWTYAGANTFRQGRAADLAAHPTVKPVELVADAIRDCSHRGGIILDPFLASGTTLVAADRTGRRGYGVEIDPAYVDVCLRRLEQETGEEAVHERGDSFAEIAAQRLRKEAA